MIDLTPELAKQLLEINNSNRPHNQMHSSRLARDMTEGRWKFNGDTIRKNGTTLIDGQHRCHAVMKSGVTVPVILVENLSSDVFDTIDSGRLRTTGDVLAIHGEKNYTTLAAALSVVESYLNGSLEKGSVRRPKSNAEILDIMKKYPDIRSSVNWCRQQNNRKLIPYSIMSGLHYLFSQCDRDVADSFFVKLTTGLELDESSSIYLLRERLMLNRTSKGKLTTLYIIAITIKAWNYWIGRKTLKSLRWRTEGESSKESFPVIECCK